MTHVTTALVNQMTETHFKKCSSLLHKQLIWIRFILAVFDINRKLLRLCKTSYSCYKNYKHELSSSTASEQHRNSVIRLHKLFWLTVWLLLLLLLTVKQSLQSTPTIIHPCTTITAESLKPRKRQTSFTRTFYSSFLKSKHKRFISNCNNRTWPTKTKV